VGKRLSGSIKARASRAAPSNVWDGADADFSGPVTEGTVETIHGFILREDRSFTDAIQSTARRFELVQIVRTTCFKHEARALDGFLEQMLEESNVRLAENAKTEERALNAALYRHTTARLGDPSSDKYRISRAAKGMAGLELLCAREGVNISFATADKIYELAKPLSRNGLCKIVDEDTSKASSGAPDDGEKIKGGGTKSSTTEARKRTSGDALAVNGNIENAPRAAGTCEDDGLPPEPKDLPLPDIPGIGTVFLPSNLNSDEVLIVALVKAGSVHKVKGPLCREDEALRLARDLHARTLAIVDPADNS
jgi:phosphoglycolate phosphatase-like HAD superfamily hydrolase